MHEELLVRLRRASRVVVFTGSGVSAESGVPTFRDAQTGLWSNFDATELATPDAFRRDPALVWGWYEWRRAVVQKAQPNAAHRALADEEHRIGADALPGPHGERLADVFGAVAIVTGSDGGDSLHQVRRVLAALWICKIAGSMGVRIDEAGSDDEPGGVNNSFGLLACT